MNSRHLFHKYQKVNCNFTFDYCFSLQDYNINKFYHIIYEISDAGDVKLEFANVVKNMEIFSVTDLGDWSHTGLNMYRCDLTCRIKILEQFQKLKVVFLRSLWTGWSIASHGHNQIHVQTM